MKTDNTGSGLNVYNSSIVGKYCTGLVYAVGAELLIMLFALLGFANSFTGWGGIFNSYNVLMVLNFPVSFAVDGVRHLLAGHVGNDSTVFHMACVLHFYFGVLQWTILIGLIFPVRSLVHTESDKSYFQNLADRYGPLSNKILVILISMLVLIGVFFLLVI